MSTWCAPLLLFASGGCDILLSVSHTDLTVMERPCDCVLEVKVQLIWRTPTTSQASCVIERDDDDDDANNGNDNDNDNVNYNDDKASRLSAVRFEACRFLWARCRSSGEGEPNKDAAPPAARLPSR